MKCPACEAPRTIPDGAFCSSCGTALTLASSPPAPFKTKRRIPLGWVAPVAFLAIVLICANWNKSFDRLVSNSHSYLGGEEWEKARSGFAEAIGIRPKDSTLHEGLGRALLGLKRYDEAAAAYEAAIAIHAGNWEAWRGLGWTRERQRRMDDAARAFLEVIRLRPEYYPIYFELAECYERGGRVDDAVEVYRRYGAMRLLEDAWSGEFGKGDLSGRMIEGYMTSSYKILKLRPDDPEAHYYVALSLLKRDLKPGDEARRHLAALRDQSGSARAAELATKLEAEMGGR
jgi:tetratricopeptide (TPR) repeat protein